MKYLHRVFKAKKGTHVIVHFSEPTKVMLIGDYDYKKYKEHKTYNYRGGQLDQSPHDFEIPNDGLWHIVIEKGGYFNPRPITASVEMVTAE
jgi:hypothetical protein